ncbi:MAG: protein kinase [Deltaproteobacteria bacterium]|nr:protein kinase [Deltaproteobacteria bacterium]
MVHEVTPTPEPTPSQLDATSTEFADTLMRELAAAPSVAPPAHHVFAAGTLLAQRYRIEGVLGKGGMGTVFAATDERLGRRVAIKVHHGRTASVARLRQEARALARLSHPNVVTVLEVGAHDGQVYVAMEYVDGPNARAWARQHRGDITAIVAMYLQAAAGLAAAHRVGIVHRDFKPDNVLVGADGRARVADFGLAAAFGGDDDETSVEIVAAHVDVGSIETREGTTVGTPAYIAPEQIGHSRVDALADQFSFCASLFEAVHGQLPFQGESAEETMAHILAGDLAEPRGGEPVPKWLDTVLRRGLARDPRQRFADMNALARALRGGGASRWRSLGVGLFASLGVAAWLLLPAAAPRDPRCDEDPREHWDELRRRVTATVEAQHSEPLTQSWQRLSAALGGKAEGMISTRDTVCETTIEQGSVERDAQLVRLDCLSRARNEIDALYREVEGADPSVIVSLIDDALALDDASGCLVEAVAVSEPAVVDTPEAATLRLSLATLEARIAAGGRASVLPFADEVVRAAAQTERADLIAEAFATRGRARAMAGAELDAAADLEYAIELARTHGEDRLVVRAAATMAQLSFNSGRDLSETDRWIDLARSHIRRWPEDAAASVSLLVLQSMVHRGMHRSDADALLDEAEAIVRSAELGGEGEVMTEQARARVASARGDYGAALRHVDRALEVARDTFGPMHPRVVQTLDLRASVYDGAGNYDEVRRALREALDIQRALTTELDHRAVATMVQLANMESLLGNGEAAVELCNQLRAAKSQRAPAPEAELQIAEACGLASFSANRLDEAYAEYMRALDVLQHVRADYDARGILENLSLIERSRGRLVEAKRFLDQALRVQDALDREDAATPALSHAYGFLLFDMGEYDQAEVMFQRAAGQTAGILGPDHMDRGWPELGLGRVALARGEAEQAIAHLEQASAAFEPDDAGPLPRAEAAVSLVEALLLAGQRARAREVAEAAVVRIDGAQATVSADVAPLRARLLELRDRVGARGRASVVARAP